MTRPLLQSLAEVHVFDDTPGFVDLGVLHVPFDSMVGDGRVEAKLGSSVLRGERTALIADSGSGKSSSVSYVLGPTAEGVAPILVQVQSFERDAAKAEKIADGVILSLERQALEASAVLRGTQVVGTEREVTRRTTRTSKAGGGLSSWLQASTARQIEEQTSTYEPIPLDAKQDMIYQCLVPIYNDDLVPVFIFDDTDRWTVSADRETISGFFGEGLRWLAELEASVVVATHRRYLETEGAGPALLEFLDSRIEIPRVPSPHHLGRILERRIEARNGIGGIEGVLKGWRLEDVVTSEAVDELYVQYESGASLREVLKFAHTALVEAADIGAEMITGSHIRIAVRLWEPKWLDGD